MTQEILRIGSDGVPQPEKTSKDSVHSESSEGGTTNEGPVGVSDKNKKDKEIGDYPRPLSVVGVSVL